MSSRPAPPSAAPGKATEGVVMRNTLFLVGAQVLGTPLSMLVNAVMARYLGARDFGTIYLTTTMWGFGAKVVEWGQPGALPAMVATDRKRAGELLGSALAWRLVSTFLVYGFLAATCHLLGYGADVQRALALVVLCGSVILLTAVCLDTVRGFERTDMTATAMVGGQLLNALLVVPVLMLGGKLSATLIAQVVAFTTVGVFVLRALRGTPIGPLSFSRQALRDLFSRGTPFLFLSMVLVLQPNIDALLLSKLSTPEAVGWHAAARKLVGALVFPIDALVGALYPTLCRLYAEDREGFNRTASSALRTATISVVPIALGCALYPDLGIRIFSRESFGPAEDNLRILSLFILLMYFSMVLGTCLTAAGLQKAWAATQAACVAVSAVVDPFLIPWFEKRAGNGGLGVCVATVLSEVLMVIVGLWLAPRGVMNRGVVRGIALSAVAGGAMALAAYLLSGITPFVAAPIAVLGYVVCLWAIGGLDKEQIQAIKGILARKARRAA